MNVKFASLSPAPNPFTEATKAQCLELRSVGYDYGEGADLFENVSFLSLRVIFC